MTKEDVLRITLQRVKETLKSNEIQMDDLQEIIMNIDDNDVPLSKADSDDSNKKTTTTIDDNDVPLSDAAPETGDHVNPAMLIAGMAVSLIAIIAIVAVMIRRRRN